MNAARDALLALLLGRTPNDDELLDVLRALRSGAAAARLGPGRYFVNVTPGTPAFLAAQRLGPISCHDTVGALVLLGREMALAAEAEALAAADARVAAADERQTWTDFDN